MAFRQNYGSKRADRNRAQKARNEEKLKARQERSAQRKAEREGTAGESGMADVSENAEKERDITR